MVGIRDDLPETKLSTQILTDINLKFGNLMSSYGAAQALPTGVVAAYDLSKLRPGV